jgi:TrkA-C domain
VPPVPLVAARRDHLVVCGEDALACRVIEELTTRYGQSVTVLLRSHSQGYGARIAALPRVRVTERAELSSDALSAARIHSARALALLGQDDLGNFHAALRAQELNPELNLAAPAFAAAMLEHQVLRTIPVGRHVLLIAGIRVTAGSELAGRPVEDVHQTGQVRVIALQRPGAGAVDWAPGKRRLLAPQDRIYVLTTRAGLSGVLARSQARLNASSPRFVFRI